MSQTIKTEQTYDLTDLTLTTNDPTVKELKLSISNSLMTNYEPSRSVDSQHSIQVAEDSNGNPMVFSVGTENELYVIVRSSDPKAPWTQINLTKGLGSGWTVETFNIFQGPSKTVYLALGIKDSGGTSHFYVTGALSNDSTSTTWTGDFTPNWTERAFSEGFTSIDHILINGGESASGPPTIVATATVPGGEQQRYYVNADVSTELNLWQAWPVPQNASEIIDVAVGSIPRLGAGSFVLYKVGSTLQLDFTKAEKMRGQYLSRPLTPPDGAMALGALQNDDGSTDLYVAGNGLFVFTSDNLGSEAQATQIGETIDAGKGTELIVRQDSKNVAVWALDEGVLYYMQGTKGDSVQWTTPLPVRKDIGQIAALRNTMRDTNELFLVTADQQLEYRYQDPSTTIWQEMLIPLADVGAAIEYKSYTTTVTILDQDDKPVTKDFTLSASEWAYLTVNGSSHIVDSEAASTVTPDARGVLTVISKVSKLSTPTLHLAGDFFSGVVDINPQAVVNNNLKLFTTESSLQNAKTQKGDSVISGSTKIPVSQAADALKQLTDLHDGTGASVSGATTRAEGDTPSHKIQSVPQNFGFAVTDMASGKPQFHSKDQTAAAVPHLHTASMAVMPSAPSALESVGDDITAFFGDVMETIENGLEEVGDFLLHAVDDVVTFTIKLAEKTVSFVLDTIQKVIRVVGWVLEQIAVAIEKVIEWIGFLFGWDDIIETKNCLSAFALKGLEFANDKIHGAEDAIESFFDGLKANLDQLLGLPDGAPASTNVRTAAGTEQSHASSMNSPGGNFSSYHMQHSGILQGPAGSGGSPGDSVLGWLQDTVMNEVTDVQADLEKGINQLSTLFNDGNLTVENVFKVLADTIADIVIDSIKNICLSALELAATFVEIIRSALTAKIDIPFLSAFYKLITGHDLTLLDGMSLLLAIPSTIVYKVVANEAPFSSGESTEITNTPASTLFAQRGSSAGAAAAKSPGEIYEGFGTIVSGVGGVINTICTTIEIQAEDEVPLIPKVQLGVSAVTLAMGIPVTGGPAEGVNVAKWGLSGLVLLGDGIKVDLGPEGAAEAAKAFAGLGMIASVVDIVLASVAIGETASTASALDWTGYVINVVEDLGGVASGLADWDPEAESKEILIVVALIAGGLGAFGEIGVGIAQVAG